MRDIVIRTQSLGASPTSVLNVLLPCCSTAKFSCGPLVLGWGNPPLCLPGVRKYEPIPMKDWCPSLVILPPMFNTFLMCFLDVLS